jgi:Permuted papain-like amidase enzyme, YaeF/YiiX, C92 family
VSGGLLKMRKILISAVVAALFACGNKARPYVPRGGDIIFHTSRSAQSAAIQRATKSRYSHMGVVFVTDGKAFVYEAVQPVKLTPLAEWVRRGDRGHFVVKRLKAADRLLTPRNLQKLEAEGRKLAGKNYDLYFEWSDERIYCSELVWKMYKRGVGIEVGALQRLRDFDLSHPAVQAKIRERWRGAPPGNELVISPAAMFESETLVTVYSR